MKIKSFLVFLFVIFTAATPHKFYFSETLIEWKSQENQLQITMRFFVDDWMKTLEHHHLPNAIADWDSSGKLYLDSTFIIQSEGRRLPLHWVGSEKEADLVYIYLEGPVPAHCKSLEIKQSSLCDTFEDQKNLVNIRKNEVTQSLYFFANDEFKTSSWP